MKKKYVKIITASIVVVITLMVIIFGRNYQKINNTKHTNIFEYLISLEDEEFAFAPSGLHYGMTKEEVIKVERLDTYEEDEYGNVSFTKDITDVLGHEAEFYKSYIFSSKDGGLVEVECFITGDAAYSEEVIEMLYNQAKEYMPTPEEGTFPSIKAGQSVTWCDYVETGEFAKAQKSLAQIRPYVPVDGKGKYEIALRVEMVYGR